MEKEVVPQKDTTKIRRRTDEISNYKPTSVTPDFPRALLVEVSNLCNHRCVFCAYGKQTRPGKQIDLKLLERLLKEGYQLGAREAGFYSGAEPFTCRHLESIIKMANDIGYEYIFVSTNGALATDERLKACIDNGLDSIKFSVNAADRETYKHIHGRDDFDKVVRHIKFASEYRKIRNPSLYLAVSFVIIDVPGGSSNVATKDWIYELLGNDVDEIVFWDAVNQNGQMFGLPETPDFRAPCSLPFVRAHISAEGFLRMCCSDYQNYLALADLNKTTLNEAWHSDLFVQMRQRHLADSLRGTLCHNCIYNVNEPINPLVPELAVKVDQKFFEFVDRVPKTSSDSSSIA